MEPRAAAAAPIRKFAAAVGIPGVETTDLKRGIFALALSKILKGLMVENDRGAICQDNEKRRRAPRKKSTEIEESNARTKIIEAEADAELLMKQDIIIFANSCSRNKGIGYLVKP
jgi:hypothetical protein